MTWLEFPVRRWQFTVVAFAMLVALGLVAIRAIPRAEDPHFPISAFLIAAAYPGADPIEMERSVAKPIEDRLNQLDDVKKLISTVSDGVTITQLEFDASVDVEKKFDEVTREINALRPDLPAGLAKVEIRKINPGLVNIVQLALLSEDAPYATLQELARELTDRLKSVPGVRESNYWAVPKRELRVAVDLQRLASLGLSPFALIDALDRANANIPGGRVEIGQRSFSVKTSGGFKDLDEVRDTVVASAAGRAIYVRDIAAVSWATAEQNYVGRFNGHRAVFVTANQKDGRNIFATRAGIYRVLDEFEQALPATVKIERGFDQSANVGARLNRLYLDLGIAICLVALTLLPLGLRAAAIVMIAIPLSLAMAVAALNYTGFSLNQLSIAGLVVALGLLVDDSVVVVENIARHLREGKDRAAAAIAGTRQIAVAIFGCTACLCLAFLPIMFMPGNAGKFIRSLPSSVLYAVTASLLVALTIIPFLASRVLPRHEQAGGNRLLRALQAGIHRVYRPALHRALAAPRLTLALTVALIAMLGLGFALFPKALFPKADTPQFLIAIETPDGSSLAATQSALDFVEAKLKADPNVAAFFSNLGNNNPKIYYNVLPLDEARNRADVFVQLKSYSTRQTPRRLDDLRRTLQQFPNAEIKVLEFDQGPPLDAPIAVRILGPDLNVLSQLARDVASLVAATEGARDVVNPLRVARTDLRVKQDTQKAALLGISNADIDRAVRLAVAGSTVGRFKGDDGEQYDIVVRTPIAARPTMDALDQVRVASASGASVPLRQVASLEFSRSPTQIQRYQRERAAVITAYAERGFNTDRVTQVIISKLNAYGWPQGYRFVMAGEVESRQESFGDLGTAIVVTVFGIFAVLVLEFSRFRSVLIVLTVIPLGAAGGLAALALTGNPLSFTAIVGFIALTGIEIKNSILLVDFTNQLRSAQVPLDEAIERAGEIRFLPILLTSATAIGGLLPLALQNSGLYSPMAWVIIGGLISSTVLGRVVTPVMYKLLPPSVEAVNPITT
jgi:multidrug efflux pump subunit AcrB